MKRPRDVRDYLQDILDAIDSIEAFTKGLAYEKFVDDKKTLYAVVHGIEIIGEAAKHIPETLRAKHNEPPWREITGMRDKISHAYFGMDPEIVWQTAKENLPPLKRVVKKMQKEQETP